MSALTRQIFLPVRDYDLAATLASGQAFRWQARDGGWEGIIGPHWVWLQTRDGGIFAETAAPVADWAWLKNYLQTEADLGAVLKAFPDDEPMHAAVAHCRGLRLLRQDPWECLASFILSSTKQIVQIQQIVALLCERFGERVTTPPGRAAAFTFPDCAALALRSERELRDCRMGFRAPNLLRAAQMVARREIDLARLHTLSVVAARDELVRLPGVGPKIANCVLLFAGGFQSAFPVDVWIMKALRELYFPRRRVGEKRIHQFAATHFGPHAGYAQQYLFHYMRTKKCPPPECRLQSAATTQITLLPTEVGVLKGAQVQFRGRCQDLPGGRRGLS